jgi:hypothetical protein
MVICTGGGDIRAMVKLKMVDWTWNLMVAIAYKVYT